jgi:large subunit ribosomal protein L29
VRAEDLRTLDGEELTSRLKTSRRELYELRFKLAVGQLDDHRQIRKVRKDIARILTVVHARRLGEEVMEIPVEPEVEVEPQAVAAEAPSTEVREAPAEPVAETRNKEDDLPPLTPRQKRGGMETPENVETPDAAEGAPASQSRRTGRRRAAREEGE